MNNEFIFVVGLVTAWFALTILIGAIHGAIDYIKGVGSFVKRPLILFALWVMACISIMTIGWLLGYGSVGRVLSYPVALFGIIGPVGCSIFLLWVHTSEIF